MAAGAAGAQAASDIEGLPARVKAASNIEVLPTRVQLADSYTKLKFTVVRSGSTQQAASFRFTTQDGTALAGSDYRPIAGIATVPVGAASAVITVDVLPQPVGNRRASALSLVSSDAFAVDPLFPLTFSATGVTQSGRYTEGMAAGDFNGDGLIDVAQSNSTLDVLLNTTPKGSTQASWAPRLSLGGSAGSFNKPAVCDFNNDGRPDLVAGDANNNRLYVFINTTPRGATTASFVRTDLVAGPWGFIGQVACADIDGDGRLDIVGAARGSDGTPGSSRAALLLNRTPAGASAAVFDAQVGFAAHTDNTYGASRTIALADFNGDGKPDIALGNPQSSDATVLLNTTVAGGPVTFAPPVNFSTEERPSDMAVLDIDGDGRPDFVTINGYSFAGGSTMTLMMNRTPPGAAVPVFIPFTQPLSGSPYGVAVADMDNDGRPDLLVTDLERGSVDVRFNRTTRVMTSPVFEPQLSAATGVDDPHSVVAIDVNRDGLVDIVTADTAPNNQMISALQTRTVRRLSVGSAAAGQLRP